jgi:hypothetical protein
MTNAELERWVSDADTEMRERLEMVTEAMFKNGK